MTDDPLLTKLAQANPQPRPVDGADDERLLAAILASEPAEPLGPTRHRRWANGRRGGSRAWALAPVLTVVIVVAVVAVFLRAGGSTRTAGAGGQPGTQRIVLRASPVPTSRTGTGPSLHREATWMREEVAALRERVKLLGAYGSVRRAGADLIVITLRHVLPLSDRTVRFVTQTASVSFTDWETNLIMPNGRIVAAGLEASSEARLLSQGRNDGPGTANAGGMTLEAAVRLASRQPVHPAAAALSRIGPEYFTFRHGGRFVAQSVVRPHAVPGQRTFIIPQGTIVVRASDDIRGGYADPSARYFVLRDDAMLLNRQIRSARVGHGAAGEPAVDLTLTHLGLARFRALTRAVAHRGAMDAVDSDRMYQHLAIINNGQLLTVPQINYNEYPDGVLTGRAVEIAGDLPGMTAAGLASAIEQAVIPLNLTIVSR